MRLRRTPVDRPVETGHHARKIPFCVANFSALTSTRAVDRGNPKWCLARGVLSVSLSHVRYVMPTISTRLVIFSPFGYETPFWQSAIAREKKVTFKRAGHAIRQHAWFTGCISLSRPHSSLVAISGGRREANYTCFFFCSFGLRCGSRKAFLVAQFYCSFVYSI